MSDFWQRLSLLIDKEDISINKFEDSIHASRGVIAKSIRNKTDISAKWLVEIKANYPQYSLDWLLLGMGDMQVVPANSDSNLIGYLREKDRRIEELLQDNLRLKMAIEQNMPSGSNENIVEILSRLEEKLDKKGGTAGNAEVAVG